MAKRPGLYANIHAKRKRIAAGSKEKMRKSGSKGRPITSLIQYFYSIILATFGD